MRETDPLSYTVRDSQNRRVDIVLYEQNLVKAEPNAQEHVRIERILSTRAARRPGQREHLAALDNNQQEWISDRQKTAYSREYY